ncbi:hypothetical protein [Kineosporia sp. NBRC 101731]|uniref:hypothetical protein n=1 Tax=Kineosporia sp. NBRC 101731 TaxID=3032199 RepID=UPI0024A08E87|nr:hypothetical protein [Kineosporia sp. NBRC 101731]GLY32873.1 hypothetical protein Kisp02_62380 [Kineosporia sp. NBRC 101731]
MNRFSLHETGTFRMGGSGAEGWPVDIEYGRSSFIEQLPTLPTAPQESRERCSP